MLFDIEVHQFRYSRRAEGDERKAFSPDGIRACSAGELVIRPTDVAAECEQGGRNFLLHPDCYVMSDEAGAERRFPFSALETAGAQVRRRMFRMRVRCPPYRLDSMAAIARSSPHL